MSPAISESEEAGLHAVASPHAHAVPNVLQEAVVPGEGSTAGQTDAPRTERSASYGAVLLNEKCCDHDLRCYQQGRTVRFAGTVDTSLTWM
jgi:hypothetical protein